MSAYAIPRPNLHLDSNRMHSDDVVIGLALGSPREQPLPPTPRQDWGEIPTTSSLPSTPYAQPEITKSSSTTRNIRAPKQKTQRWKGLGGMFGRKVQLDLDADVKPLYSLERNPPLEMSKPKPGPASPVDLSSPDIRNWIQTGPHTHAPPSHANKPSQNVEERGLFRRASSRRKGLRKMNSDAARPSRPRAMTAPSTSIANRPTAPIRYEGKRMPPKSDMKASLLQVEIPNVELERYSVMFKDLLQPSRFAELAPSLPEMPEPLITESTTMTQAESIHVPPRPKSARKDSASSTSSKTPSFSLFPPPSSPNRAVSNKPLPKPSPLSRAVTAPDVTVAAQPRPPLKTSKTQESSRVMILLQQQDTMHGSPRTLDPRAQRGQRHIRQNSSLNYSFSSTVSKPISTTSTSFSSGQEVPLVLVEDSLSQYQASIQPQPQPKGYPTRSSSLKKSSGPPLRTANLPSSNLNNKSPIPPTPPPKNSPISPLLPALPTLPTTPFLEAHPPQPLSQHHHYQLSQNENTSSATSSVSSITTKDFNVSGKRETKAAEVGIARQVSLSRREKKEVHVPTPVIGGLTPISPPLPALPSISNESSPITYDPPDVRPLFSSKPLGRPHGVNNNATSAADPTNAAAAAGNTRTGPLAATADNNDEHQVYQLNPPNRDRPIHNHRTLGLGLGGVGVGLGLQGNMTLLESKDVDAARRVQMVRAGSAAARSGDASGGGEVGTVGARIVGNRADTDELAGRKSEYVFYEEG